jgi:hypothetical protein
MKAQVSYAPDYRLRQRKVVDFDGAFMARNLSEATNAVQGDDRFRSGLIFCYVGRRLVSTAPTWRRISTKNLARHGPSKLAIVSPGSG